MLQDDKLIIIHCLLNPCMVINILGQSLTKNKGVTTSQWMNQTISILGKVVSKNTLRVAI